MRSIISGSFVCWYHILLVLLTLTFTGELEAQCGSATPSFTANLIGIPGGTIIVPNVSRNDTCCGATAPDKCIKITIYLDPGAVGINFQVYGAVPPGALYYQIGCGPQIPVGTPICLNGQGPHILTFCKPGNNINSYGIISIPGPQAPDSILIRNGCSDTLAVTGFSVPTITWNSINPGLPGAYNGYLNCTVGCASVIVTPTGTPPPYVDYQVTGYGDAPCVANSYTRTVRVYFYQDLLANITPSNPTICFGSTSAVLTASVSGGLPPYTYTWTTGSNNQSVTVGAGTYAVLVEDNTGCPPTTATAIVSQFTLPITANPGSPPVICKSSPTVPLSGTIGVASGGIWSGGSGTFTPSDTLLTTSYIPTASEISSGSVQLVLTSTGNQGCTPGSGTINVTFQNPPSVSAGGNQTVCANNNLVSLTGSVTGFPSTVVWTSSGSGTFASTTNSVTSYSPSNADVTTGSLNIVLTSTNNGACPPATATVNVKITPKPIVNAGNDQIICSNSSAVLTGIVTSSAATGSWTTTGDGSFAPNVSALNASYTPGPNDIVTGTVSLILSSTNNGNCLPEKDTLKLTIKKLAVVNAGLNQALCSATGSVALSGTVTGSTNTGTWSASGSGAFGTGTLSTTYSFTPADILNGSVIFTLSSTNNGPCPVVADTMKISIRTIATVSAGVNQVICSSQPTIAVTGMVTGISGTGSWLSSGSGTFLPNNQILSTSYSVTSADINAGFVTFTLVSTNNGVCPVVTDTVKMRIVKLASVNAGPNKHLCSNAGVIVLSGTVSGAVSTGSWASSGTGNFNPNSSTLITTYSMTPADISNGFVTFTLVSANNVPCPFVSDTVIISISTLASVNSGGNQVVCSSQNTIALNGSVVSAAGTGSWTASGAGSFLPGSSLLSTSYSIAAADLVTGLVTFTLSSTNNGVCPAVKDTVTMKIVTLPVVDAGISPSMSICSTQPSVVLGGTVSGGNLTGLWTSSGSGSFNPSASVLNTSYFISSNDITQGEVLLILTSTNNGPCPAAEDSLSVYIKTPAQVNAGFSQTVCSNTGTINLNGGILGNFGALWTTSGDGAFIPGNTSLNTTYSLSIIDQAGGIVNFTLTSTNNDGCPAVSSEVSLLVKKLAVVNAGSDKTICSTTQNVNLAGIINGAASAGIWTSSGTGSFVPGAAYLNTIYYTSNADITNKTVWLVLSSTNNDVCPVVSDSLRVTIVESPKVSLKLDTTICEKQYPFKLDALVIGGSGKMQWFSSGTGSISPSNEIPAYYYFSSADVSTGTLDITLSATNNGPCADVNADMRLVIHPSAKASFAVSSDVIDLPGGDIVFTNQAINADSYNWDFGDNTAAKIKNPSHGYHNVGYYTITLIANNEFNCSDTTQRQIKVISDVRFPTAFSPNPNGSNGGSYDVRDYSNDVFFPYTAGVVEYDLAIFNRWGELIFRTNNIEVGWDGYFRGKLCQQDAYVWKADIKFFDGRTYSKTGSVTLLK